MNDLQPAIDYFGSQVKLASAIGVSPMATTQWKIRGIPALRAKQIERLSNGAIKASSMRPDIFD